MPLPRASLRSFLSTAQTALQNAEHTSPAYAVVLGNESADLDSLCSAVVFAYLRTYAPRSKTFYIPLSNLERRDLVLRPELIPVLRHAGLKPSDLITLGDLKGAEKARGSEGNKKDASRWILVDHNRMTGELGKIYAGSVVGCVDHHVDEQAVPGDCVERGEPRIVEVSGSCASLVVGYCKETWDAMSASSSAGAEINEQETTQWNQELARLAVAPILIDTQNLKDASKTTDFDREAATYLQSWLGGSEGSYSSEEYFDEITAAKGDIGGLALEDILRKDYKLWVEDRDGAGTFNLGISAVVKNISWLAEKAGGADQFVAVLEAFMTERELDLCSVMTTWNDEKGVFRRDLLVYGRGAKGFQAAQRFEESQTGKLGLRSWGSGALDAVSEGDLSWRRCWEQGSVNNSRKQVAPLMREAVANLK